LLAGDWANPNFDPSGAKFGWAVVDTPRRGDIFGFALTGGASGHVGIYVGNGYGVWANLTTIRMDPIESSFPGKKFTYRRYMGGSN
jgi:cell wall-associated NlpC family hydrolase